MLTAAEIMDLSVGSILCVKYNNTCIRVKNGENSYIYTSYSQEPWQPDRSLAAFAVDQNTKHNIYLYDEPNDVIERFLQKIKDYYPNLVILYPNHCRVTKRRLILTVC